MVAKRGPKVNQIKLGRVEALHLANVLNNLTPSRVGSNEEFRFLAALVAKIEFTFRDSEPAGDHTVSESGDGNYGSRIFGNDFPDLSVRMG